MGRCLGRGGQAQPLGQRAVGGGAAERSGCCRHGAWRPAGRGAHHHLHGQPGAAVDDPQPLQAGGGAHPGGAARGGPLPGGPGPVDLWRSQRCDGHPRQRLRDSLLGVGAGGRRLCRHCRPAQPAQPAAVPACVRWLSHLPRDPEDRAAQRRPAARADARGGDQRPPRPRPQPQSAGDPRHQPKPRRLLPGARIGKPLLRRGPGPSDRGDGALWRAHWSPLPPLRLRRPRRCRAGAGADGFRLRNRCGGG